jgi:hypothetical protein
MRSTCYVVQITFATSRRIRECKTQENNISAKYEQNFVTYVEFIHDRKPNTAQ